MCLIFRKFICGPTTLDSSAKLRLSDLPIITMYSADTVTNEDGSDNINDNLYPIEFLNSLNVQGFPLHSPELMSKFLNNITDALILSSNLCSGKP